MRCLHLESLNRESSSLLSHDHLPQVDKEHPKSHMDIHPLESIAEEKDPELVELPLRQQTQDLAKRKYQKERHDLMCCERFLLKYWHGRIGHLSGLQRTITLVWRQSPEMACQQRTGFRCKRNKGIYYWKFRCNQEGGGRYGNDTRVASTVRCNQGELS